MTHQSKDRDQTLAIVRCSLYRKRVRYQPFGMASLSVCTNGIFVLVNINTGANNRRRSGCADGRIVNQAGKRAAAPVLSHIPVTDFDMQECLKNGCTEPYMWHKVTTGGVWGKTKQDGSNKRLFLKSRKGQVVTMCQLTQGEGRLCACARAHAWVIGGETETCQLHAGSRK